ncbi:MAG: formate--tetrahydrofolate ligase, partial [Tannerellaceae bacterium]
CTGTFEPIYTLDQTPEEKIFAISTEIYGADGVDYTSKAKTHLKRIYDLGLDKLPICMAKTQKSLSDNPNLIGRPTGFNITIREIEIAAGAGFIVPITGDMMRMPGLPEEPAAEKIDIDNNGVITGLF